MSASRPAASRSMVAVGLANARAGSMSHHRQPLGGPGRPVKEQIAERLQSTGPSGSDPKPHLEQLRIPARWLYGTADREIPVDQSVALLNALKSQDEDFTVVTFPDSGHGLLHSPPTDPQAPTIFVEWVEKKIHTGSQAFVALVGECPEALQSPLRRGRVEAVQRKEQDPAPGMVQIHPPTESGASDLERPPSDQPLNGGPRATWARSLDHPG